nr:transposase [Lunatibacter salilacus]
MEGFAPTRQGHTLTYWTAGPQKWAAIPSPATPVAKAGASNPAFLGVDSGCLSVLHTWGQALNYHPHIHMLVTAGGPDPDKIKVTDTKYVKIPQIKKHKCP